jgi:hypothetical protein
MEDKPPLFFLLHRLMFFEAGVSFFGELELDYQTEERLAMGHNHRKASFFRD